MFKHKINFLNSKKFFEKLDKKIVSHFYSDVQLTKNKKLSNVIVTLKDSFATQDAKTTASSKILQDFYPSYDATVVKKLKEAGATIIAKVHLDELGLGGTGEYSSFGLITHPLDSSRIIGGSSSGSIASFGKNVSVAIASDTGDSVRLPASYNGFVGFKPSYGAVSRYGLFAFASSLDTVGWITHNVHDAIITSQVLFGKDSKDMTSINVDIPEAKVLKPKKVLVFDSDIYTKTQKKYLNDLIKKLKNQSIAIKRISIDENLLNQIGTVYQVISFVEASSNDSNLTSIHFGTQASGKNWKEIIFNSRSKFLGNMVQKRFVLGALFSHQYNQKDIFLKALQIRRFIKNYFDSLLSKYDVLIYPSTKIAPKIKVGKEDNWYSDFLGYANLVGNPSITLPFGKEEKMPFGLSVDSKIYNDKKLLSFALYFEKLLGERDE